MATTSSNAAARFRPRMGRLAKLPVFFDLAGKRAVLAGGTAAAAWKVELLAAAGANVEIYAIELEPQMADLVAQGAASGSINHHRSDWRDGTFSGAAIALADAQTDSEAAEFYHAAVAAGVPVNVIDKPEYCQFQFGSIVNRSPVIVSISTDGAAPILGQAIRRRIEALLPPTLADWGQLAKDIRDDVTSRLAPGPQRRSFWERFSDRAFGNAPNDRDRQSAGELIVEITTVPAAAHGKVTIIDARPGDPELLTLKAVRALQSADAIMFDESVTDEVLELARREVTRVPMSLGGNPDNVQLTGWVNEISTIASQGKQVVVLHSGGEASSEAVSGLIQIIREKGILVA